MVRSTYFLLPDFAERAGVSAPIATATAEVLEGKVSIDNALEHLMVR